MDGRHLVAMGGLHQGEPCMRPLLRRGHEPLAAQGRELGPRRAAAHLQRGPLGIAGGESGPGARPMPEEWPRSLAAQCKAAGVPFLMKQMGGVRDKRGALEDLPEDLRVREFPRAA